MQLTLRLTDATAMKHTTSLMPEMVEKFAGLGTALASMMFLWTMLRPYFPHQLFDFYINRYLKRYTRRVVAFVDPYLSVTIAEYEGERMKRSEAYEQAKVYLSHKCSRGVRNLKAETSRDGDKFVLSMGDHEEVTDEFRGATVWWLSVSRPTKQTHYAPPWYGGGGGAYEDRRYYQLVFHERHRELVVDAYLPHVCCEGRAIMVRNRCRKLFTNIASDRWDFGHKKSVWSHVVFEHPSTFDTIGMDPAKKREIMDDLDMFRRGKEYYARIGKAWKRGYLLYGPPGTGKSTMIAAMANYLDYDIYDVELTSVRTNTDLRKLFIETTSKSIIVIEDIDCSLDLTGKRKKKKAATGDDTVDGKDQTKPPKEEQRYEDPSASKVTLSGLLNFIDGLWSACGGERIIVFTTNHIERLDPALIRRGRMDKHIEMSYCCFEAFKFLAKNYHGVDSHPLFDAVKEVLQEVNMTPADVAENLMPKCADDDEHTCLSSLVKALEKAKEEAAKKASSNQQEEEILEDE